MDRLFARLLITAFVLTLGLNAALASDVRTTGDKRVYELDCRPGESFWDTNKGTVIDLSEDVAQSYKDNGHTMLGAPEASTCFQGNVGVVCSSSSFVLEILDITNTERQVSSDAGDALGALVGVAAKRVTVVRGTMTTAGFLGLFDRSREVSCAVTAH